MLHTLRLINNDFAHAGPDWGYKGKPKENLSKAGLPQANEPLSELRGPGGDRFISPRGGLLDTWWLVADSQYLVGSR